LKEKPVVQKVVSPGISKYRAQKVRDALAEFTKQIDTSEAYTGRKINENDLYTAGSTYISESLRRDEFKTYRGGLYSKPTGPQSVIKECIDMYKTVGVIKNVVDLMSDFTADGLKFYHSNPSVEKFFSAWVKLTNLENRIERVANLLFKAANVVIYKIYGKFERDKRYSGKMELVKEEDFDIFKTPNKKNSIPVRYVILNPENINIKNYDFFTKPVVEYYLSPNVINALTNDDDPMSADIKKLFNTTTMGKGNRIVLDNDRIVYLAYKKDDFQDMAEPLIASILEDLKYKKQMRLMDISVMNGIIYAKTLWKLGKIKEGLDPSPVEFRKLAAMLQKQTKSKDIIWHEGIEMQTDYPPVGDILGSQKYEAVNKDITYGLGIPEVLLGGGGKGGSYANSYLAVKGLLEKLETARGIILNEWIYKDLKDICRAMGFRKLPHVTFNKMTLRDEIQEKNVLIKMADRQLISYETLMDLLGIDKDVEVQRMREEEKIRREENILLNPQVESIKIGQKRTTNVDTDPNYGGRPPGEKKKQEKTRDTKPTGASREYIERQVRLLYPDIKENSIELIISAVTYVCSQEGLPPTGKNIKNIVSDYKKRFINKYPEFVYLYGKAIQNGKSHTEAYNIANQ